MYLFFVWEKLGRVPDEGGMLYRGDPVLVTTNREVAKRMCLGEDAQYVFSFVQVFHGEVVA